MRHAVRPFPLIRQPREVPGTGTCGAVRRHTMNGLGRTYLMGAASSGVATAERATVTAGWIAQHR